MGWEFILVFVTPYGAEEYIGTYRSMELCMYRASIEAARRRYLGKSTTWLCVPNSQRY
jgi:hypothetical protein